jgi:hypothetical protein
MGEIVGLMSGLLEPRVPRRARRREARAVVVLALAGRSGASDRALGLSSHAAMLLGMLVLMIARRGEYAHARHRHAAGPDDGPAADGQPA